MLPCKAPCGWCDNRPNKADKIKSTRLVKGMTTKTCGCCCCCSSSCSGNSSSSSSSSSSQERMIEVVNSQDCDGFNKRMRLRGLTGKPPKEAKAKAKGVAVPKGARTGPKRPLGWSGWSRSTPDHQQQEHQVPPPPTPPPQLPPHPPRKHTHNLGLFCEIRSYGA